MSLDLWVSILAGALALSTPILLAGAGEGFVERAGRLNLGIEGMMILGALTGVYVAHLGGPALGMLAAVAVGMACAAVMNVAVYRLRANEVVVGLAVTMIGLGLSTFLFQLWIPSGTTNVSVPTFGPVDLGPLSTLPIVGPVLFSQSPLFYTACAVVIAAGVVLRFTRFGLRVRAVGADTVAAELRGVRASRVGAHALVLGGGLAGFAGAAITVGSIGSFTPDITAGRGYVVLAVVIMGRMTPVGIFLGALLFAFLQSFALLSQSAAAIVPSEVYQALPYLVTLVVLILTARARIRRARAAVPS